MYLKSLELSGFKSFAKKAQLAFKTPITAIVGPNGSGKSNIAEAFRFVLGEQRISQLRGKRTEDLIWNGSQKVPKSGRADVKLTFDNLPRPERRGRLLDVDFDEVTAERVIYRDSSTEYLLNGSPVRLKDLVELLAGAHIGASGHHIISQGETDRILNVNARERKEMIEDALGLKVYQYKKEESIRKLEKTEENMKEVGSLRREIKPHLTFLERQVAKVEKAREMRAEIIELYQKYFTYEDAYLKREREALERERTPLEREMKKLERELTDARTTLEALEGEESRGRKILDLERTLSETRTKKDTLMRDLGRLEGELAAHERVREREETQTVSVREVRGLSESIIQEIAHTEGSDDVSKLKELLTHIRERLAAFVERVAEGTQNAEGTKALEELRRKKEILEKSLGELQSEEEKLEAAYAKLKKSVEADKDSGREAERMVFAIGATQGELRLKLQKLTAHDEQLTHRERDRDDERREATALVGETAVARTREHASDEHAQEERRKHINKLKVRLEDAGGGSGEEIVKEYQEVAERDTYLERELGDLEQSAESLKRLITELDETLRMEFQKGLQKINDSFQELFATMFGGGTASLKLVREKTRRQSDIDIALMRGEDIDEDEGVLEEGIEVAVSLPRKRVKGLQMLSGGERALTSIALLFAMSQVNPPPFLILDETDAALDEANSRRYGDMVERLAEHSQIILITHNRETMSRAGVLYGVTMGADGVSQLLSVDFEEAVKVAK
jgi:chromosome segregation protein